MEENKPIFVEFGSRGKNNTAWQKRLSYESMRNILRNCAIRAKINKPVRLHWARKSTASLYSSHFNNTILLDQWFGWSGGIHDTYVGLSTKKLLEQYKLFYSSEDNELRPLQCTTKNCNHLNMAHLEFCAKCGSKLVEKMPVSRMDTKASEILDLLTGNPKVLKMMAEALNKDKKAVEVMNLG